MGRYEHLRDMGLSDSQAFDQLCTEAQENAIEAERYYSSWAERYYSSWAEQEYASSTEQEPGASTEQK
jgi:hypothetical protein